MNILLWIFFGLLAIAYIGIGFHILAHSYWAFGAPPIGRVKRGWHYIKVWSLFYAWPLWFVYVLLPDEWTIKK